MGKQVFGYGFFEGDKGVVFAIDKEQAEEKVSYTYGKEYCAAHKLTIREASMWDNDVYCTVDTWK